MFEKVRGIRPRRSAFDLSHSVKTTMDMGMLVPVLFEEVLPTDTFNISNRTMIRMAPLVAPIMHPINYTIHYFYCPTRLLMEKYPDMDDNPHLADDMDWDEFITGGKMGTSVGMLPLWSPLPLNDPLRSVGELWDYFRHPITLESGSPVPGSLPLAFDKRVYNRVWNEYYRDENLQDPIDLDDEHLKYRSWRKDYFTSALPFQQRGVSPSFPVDLSFDGVDLETWLSTHIVYSPGATTISPFTFSNLNPETVSRTTGGSVAVDNTVGWFANFASQLATSFGNSTAGFNINDLRTAVQVQRYMELVARAGYRYIEWLRAVFGASPRDERLQRPEYIGGTSSPLIVSEVLQTSSTDAVSPQANMSGHGITAGGSFVCRYTAYEHGYIIGLMSIMPQAIYENGMARQSLRRSKEDFYNPVFANLSEQMIYRGELCWNGTDDRVSFGYQGRYDEYRIRHSAVTGLFRGSTSNPTGSLDFWHIDRQFDYANPPVLSGEFISTRPGTIGAIRKDIFAFYSNEPNAHGFYVNCGNLIKAIRPMPYMAEPGRMDHV